MALFVSELGCQESLHEVDGSFLPDDTRSKAKDIHVVVFHALVGGVMVVTETGPDTDNLISGHGGADPTATDQDAAFGLPIQHSCSKIPGAVRVVVRLRGVMGAEIEHVMAEPAQLGDDDFVQRNASMVGGDSNSHGAYLVPPWRTLSKTALD